jgi:hypothetical protein
MTDWFKGLLNKSNNSERFELAIKVISAYNSFEPGMSSKNKTKLFIENRWGDFINEFDMPSASQNIIEKVVKLTLGNIIKRRSYIRDIKREVNL